MSAVLSTHASPSCWQWLSTPFPKWFPSSCCSARSQDPLGQSPLLQHLEPLSYGAAIMVGTVSSSYANQIKHRAINGIRDEKVALLSTFPETKSD